MRWIQFLERVLDRMKPGRGLSGRGSGDLHTHIQQLKEIMERRTVDVNEPPFIMVLDEISDPHN